MMKLEKKKNISGIYHVVHLKIHRKRSDKIRKGCLIFAILAAMLLTVWIVKERGMTVEAKVEETTASLSKEVLRFHVLANSDSKEDQQLKLQVKEAVVSYLRELFEEAEASERTLSLEETKALVEAHLPDIERVATRTIQAHGEDYPVYVELSKDDFPKKRYGDITFPAGRYEALRIEIGHAQGHNWWCCLYPKICFMDVTQAHVSKEDKEELANVLDESAYEMVTCMTSFKMKWFFFPEKENE